MRIGILTGGGDCPGLNAAIRSAFYRARKYGYETVAIYDGWKGLIEGGHTEVMKEADVKDIYNFGGTILGSSRTNPYKIENGEKQVLENIKKHKLDAVIAIGGEDTLGVAAKLHKAGVKIVGIPKTVDHDLSETDYTIGFDTALNVAAESIDRLHTTAKSHNRVMIVEIMGRHAGWLTLMAGIAGGAHIILIPEKKVNIDKVCEKVLERKKRGERYTIIAVSEGIEMEGHGKEKKKLDAFGHIPLTDQGLARTLQALIAEKTGMDVKAMVLGHLLRGGAPNAYDRITAAKIGASAVDYIKEKKFGMMTGVNGGKVTPVALEKAVAKLKTVKEEDFELLEALME